MYANEEEFVCADGPWQASHFLMQSTNERSNKEKNNKEFRVDECQDQISVKYPSLVKMSFYLLGYPLPIGE